MGTLPGSIPGFQEIIVGSSILTWGLLYAYLSSVFWTVANLIGEVIVCARDYIGEQFEKQEASLDRRSTGNTYTAHACPKWHS